jgi:hypothetical protein
LCARLLLLRGGELILIFEAHTLGFGEMNDSSTMEFK